MDDYDDDEEPEADVPIEDIERLIGSDFAGYQPSAQEQILASESWMCQNEPMCEFVAVTPYVAANWLKHNIHNRVVRPSGIERLKHDMAAGRFVVTGDPVRFDLLGNMNDGQYRLLSMLQLGITLSNILVVRGLPEEARDYFDVGTKRRLADVLTIGGMGGTDANATSAGINYALRWERAFDVGGPRNVSRDMEIKWAELHSQEMVDSAQQTKAAAKGSGLKPAPMAAMHFFITNGPTVDMEPSLYTAVDMPPGIDIDGFLDALGSGAGLNNDDPILCLRNWIAQQQRAQKAEPLLRWTAAMVVTWNAWVAGQTYKRLTVPRVGSGKNAAPFPALSIPINVVVGSGNGPIE